VDRSCAAILTTAAILSACGAPSAPHPPRAGDTPPPGAERDDPRAVPPSPAPEPTAFEQCWGKPRATDAPRGLASIEELVADGDLETAGRAFLAASRDPAAPDAPACAMRALEVMNEIGSLGDLPRPACYDLVAEEVPRMMDTLCAPSPRAGAEGVCVTLRAIALDLLRPID
jgi:hypothetical protein